jgi:hypothetical protein
MWSCKKDVDMQAKLPYSFFVRQVSLQGEMESMMTEAKDNAGYAGGIGKRRKGIRLSFALAGAPVRKKDLRLNAVGGVAEARKLRDRVTGIMQDHDAKPGEALVYLIVANPDLSGGLDTREVSISNGPADLELLQHVTGKLPIGFLVFVRDAKDKKQPVFGHARPLIVEGADGERSIAMNERALNAVNNAIKRQLGITKEN